MFKFDKKLIWFFVISIVIIVGFYIFAILGNFPDEYFQATITLIVMAITCIITMAAAKIGAEISSAENEKSRIKERDEIYKTDLYRILLSFQESYRAINHTYSLINEKYEKKWKDLPALNENIKSYIMELKEIFAKEKIPDIINFYEYGYVFLIKKELGEYNMETLRNDLQNFEEKIRNYKEQFNIIGNYIKNISIINNSEDNAYAKQLNTKNANYIKDIHIKYNENDKTIQNVMSDLGKSRALCEEFYPKQIKKLTIGGEINNATIL